MVEMVPGIEKNHENKSLVCEALYLPENKTYDNDSGASSVRQYLLKILNL